MIELAIENKTTNRIELADCTPGDIVRCINGKYALVIEVHNDEIGSVFVSDYKALLSLSEGRGPALIAESDNGCQIAEIIGKMVLKNDS